MHEARASGWRRPRSASCGGCSCSSDEGEDRVLVNPVIRTLDRVGRRRRRLSLSAGRARACGARLHGDHRGPGRERRAGVVSSSSFRRRGSSNTSSTISTACSSSIAPTTSRAARRCRSSGRSPFSALGDVSRIAVAATAPFGADVLERLSAKHEISSLLTRPDAPAGSRSEARSRRRPRSPLSGSASRSSSPSDSSPASTPARRRSWSSRTGGSSRRSCSRSGCG